MIQSQKKTAAKSKYHLNTIIAICNNVKEYVNTFCNGVPPDGLDVINFTRDDPARNDIRGPTADCGNFP